MGLTKIFHGRNKFKVGDRVQFWGSTYHESADHPTIGLIIAKMNRRRFLVLKPSGYIQNFDQRELGFLAACK